jgi:hypothetical protein
MSRAWSATSRADRPAGGRARKAPRARPIAPAHFQTPRPPKAALAQRAARAPFQSPPPAHARSQHKGQRPTRGGGSGAARPASGRDFTSPEMLSANRRPERRPPRHQGQPPPPSSPRAPPTPALSTKGSARPEGGRKSARPVGAGRALPALRPGGTPHRPEYHRRTYPPERRPPRHREQPPSPSGLHARSQHKGQRPTRGVRARAPAPAGQVRGCRAPRPGTSTRPPATHRSPPPSCGVPTARPPAALPAAPLNTPRTVPSTHAPARLRSTDTDAIPT